MRAGDGGGGTSQPMPQGDGVSNAVLNPNDGVLETNAGPPIGSQEHAAHSNGGRVPYRAVSRERAHSAAISREPSLELDFTVLSEEASSDPEAQIHPTSAARPPGSGDAAPAPLFAGSLTGA